MLRLLFSVLSISISAIGVVSYLENDQEKAKAVVEQVQQNRTATKPKTIAAKKPTRISGEERIPRNAQGHYLAEFKINNARVQGLVDTGATTIAINESTARKAGIRLNRSDFNISVNTANGQTKAARATIRQVSFGSIRIRDVEAMVLSDKALSHTLIGMSFMNRLKGFEYQAGNLVLKR